MIRVCSQPDMHSYTVCGIVGTLGIVGIRQMYIFTHIHDFRGRNWSLSIHFDLILSVQEVTRAMYKRYVPTCIGLRLRFPVDTYRILLLENVDYHQDFQMNMLCTGGDSIYLHDNMFTSGESIYPRPSCFVT